jgi:TPR repeat protein
MMYLEGRAVARDEARALELIRAAADQNLTDAVHQLAELYACGIGEPRSASERPVALLERVGKWGDLQLRYEHGLGTDRDLVLAARCYCKMVINSKWNHSGADLAKMINYRPELGDRIGTQLVGPIDRHLTLAGPPHRVRTDASDDVLRTLSIYLKSARGDGTAAFRIGEDYEKGLNTPKSGRSAWAWFNVAAQHGNADAREKLAASAHQMNRDELQEAQKWLASLQADLKEIAPYLR